MRNLGPINTTGSMPVSGAVKRGALRTATLAGLLLGAVAVAPSAYAGNRTANEGQPAVSATVRDGLVSVEAREASLASVLEAIAERADFELSIKGNIERVVTWSFKDVPVDQAVLTILRHVSSVVTYSPDGRAVVYVHVLRSGGESYGAAAQVNYAFPTKPIPRTSIDWLEREDRVRAVQDLIREPDATAIEDLTRLVSEDEDPTIRSMAVIGLSGARDYEAKEALIAALSDDDSFVRSQAVQVLGRIWGEDAVEPLNKAALEHPDPAMRREAALMLRIIRNVADLESLTP